MHLLLGPQLTRCARIHPQSAHGKTAAPSSNSAECSRPSAVSLCSAVHPFARSSRPRPLSPQTQNNAKRRSSRGSAIISGAKNNQRKGNAAMDNILKTTSNARARSSRSRRRGRGRASEWVNSRAQRDSRRPRALGRRLDGATANASRLAMSPCGLDPGLAKHVILPETTGFGRAGAP